MSNKSTMPTIMGLCALLMWSCSIPVSRTVAERLGPISTGAYAFTIAGLLGLAHTLFTGKMKQLLLLPGKYLLVCGLIVVTYIVVIYLVIGFASSRQQVIEVGVVNYLWPALTLALSVPLLGARPRLWFWPGVLVAMAGVFIAAGSGGGADDGEKLTLAGMMLNICRHPVIYLSAFCAAVLWGTYSNLSRLMLPDGSAGGVSAFLLTAGLVLWLMRPLAPYAESWTPGVAAELAFAAVFPSCLAYVFWERAMKGGSVRLVVSASYAVPVLSTILGSLHFGVMPQSTVWLACGLVVVGAVMCRLSISEPAASA